MPRSILQTSRLSMHFGGVTALDKVDFALEDKELRCLIGPNGAGKSTFFKCLTGMLQPSSGEIFIRGQSCAGLQPFQIAQLGVGIKTQVPSVLNGLSVDENLWLAASRTHSGKKTRHIVGSVLEQIGIGDIAQQRVAELSHGKRQLVEFGTVLAMRPWLVLLDEPAAGMTAEEVERTADIMLQINRYATLIVVEHDMHFIRRIAKKVTVFHQGKILLEDDVDKVLADEQVRDVYLGKQA